MKAPPFEYRDPRTLDEALAALSRYGDDAKVLAGGQSLVPMLNFRLARPAVLVDVNRVGGLDALREAGDTLHLGALVRQRQLERWAISRAPLLAAGLRLIGHAAIRNRGTVAGSLAHADPAAELPALLLCCEGSVIARRHGGERVIVATELFQGPLMTALGADELIVETRWPLPPAGAGWGFHEVARRHGDFALAGAAALVTLAGGRVERARVAIFGCGPTPLRVLAAEQVLAGRAPSPAALDEAARAGTASLPAESDIHASADYRRRAGRTLVSRALGDAVSRAKEAA